MRRPGVDTTGPAPPLPAQRTAVPNTPHGASRWGTADVVTFCQPMPMTDRTPEPQSPAPSPDDLPTTYRAADVETALYARWQAAGTDVASAGRVDRIGGARAPYTIVMPPPNVTAILHVGHGLNNTVQDVLIRWRRMAGDEALWVPGTDHAGIATQNVVEKQLAAEGSSRGSIGREAFVARTAQFVEKTGGQILESAQGHRRERRLDAHGVHALGADVCGRDGGVRAPVRGRPGVSRPPRDSLVPALHDIAL